MEILLQREGNALVAADHMSFDELLGVERGAVLRAKITYPRNPAHHRMFMAFLSTVLDNQEKHATLEGLLNEIKIALGHCDKHKIKMRGVVVEYAVPKSISFASMSQDKFKEFYEPAVAYVLKEYMGNMNKKLFESAIMQKMEGNLYA